MNCTNRENNISASPHIKHTTYLCQLFKLLCIYLVSPVRKIRPDIVCVCPTWAICHRSHNVTFSNLRIRTKFVTHCTNSWVARFQLVNELREQVTYSRTICPIMVEVLMHNSDVINYLVTFICFFLPMGAK